MLDMKTDCKTIIQVEGQQGRETHVKDGQGDRQTDGHTTHAAPLSHWDSQPVEDKQTGDRSIDRHMVGRTCSALRNELSSQESASGPQLD